MVFLEDDWVAICNQNDDMGMESVTLARTEKNNFITKEKTNENVNDGNRSSDMECK